MHKYIKQQHILGDLLMILILFLQQETNDLIDPTVPSLGRVVAPSNPGRALVIDVLLKDKSINLLGSLYHPYEIGLTQTISHLNVFS
ncbi:hypothetical protein PGTUg99_035659 [Puccinia graminis f. sp. tritici]|uniref:Uncharacterized protein n=1 Tax=Puccinia graminis f. sp. tritici TaxID=56615 RepID=A0A5B0LXR7_PUCGR|nr:hypothetical protein PGTUg99_035659 [Puccinia graminis f. sp. tritici]